MYELVIGRGEDPGPWIGAEIALSEQPAPEEAGRSDLGLPRRRSFVPAPAGTSAGFLALVRREFRELGAAGEVLHAEPREYAIPTRLGTNTVSCAVLRRAGGVVEMGLDEDDLPAVQCFEGTSAIWVTPAWRLPKDLTTRTGAEAWVAARLLEEYGVEARSIFELGGRYHPSAGVTPELVFPLAVDAAAVRPARRPLRWFPLDEIVGEIRALSDGHLRVAALRAAHALGWPKLSAEPANP